MSRTLVLIGTRKGCFVLESDADRRDWSLRGPFCESWPVYHAVYDQGSGTIFAGAASDWHGSAIWRSSDLGETWEHSSRGTHLRGRPAFLEGLDARRRPRPPARRRRGAGHLREPGRRQTFSLLSTLAGEPGSEGWDDPANQPPGHLGISGIELHPDDPARFYAIVQGVGLWETTDGGSQLDAAQPRAPRRLAPRARGGRLLRAQARPCRRPADVPAEPRRHAPHRRRRRLVDRDHRRAADGVRVRRGGQPARPRHVPRDPARPGPRRGRCPTARRRSG